MQSCGAGGSVQRSSGQRAGGQAGGAGRRAGRTRPSERASGLVREPPWQRPARPCPVPAASSRKAPERARAQPSPRPDRPSPQPSRAVEDEPEEEPEEEAQEPGWQWRHRAVQSRRFERATSPAALSAHMRAPESAPDRLQQAAAALELALQRIAADQVVIESQEAELSRCRADLERLKLRAAGRPTHLARSPSAERLERDVLRREWAKSERAEQVGIVQGVFDQLSGLKAMSEALIQNAVLEDQLGGVDGEAPAPAGESGLVEELGELNKTLEVQLEAEQRARADAELRSERLESQLREQLSATKDLERKLALDMAFEMARQKELVLYRLSRTPLGDRPVEGLTGGQMAKLEKQIDNWFRQPAGRAEAAKLESKVNKASSPSDLVVLLLEHRQKERHEWSVQFLSALSEIKQQLGEAETKIAEHEEQADEMHALLGQRRLAAIKLIKRRVQRFRLAYQLKGLGGCRLQKRIKNMATADSVLKEMVQVACRFSRDLGSLNAHFLDPIQRSVLAAGVGGDKDPHGWINHEFSVFSRAVCGLKEVHDQHIPAFEEEICANLQESSRDRLLAVSQFYRAIVEGSQEHLVKYMNRITKMMKLVKDKGMKADSGKKMRDFVWELQQSQPPPANKNPADFYLFGVLQCATNMESLLKRLKKLTPKAHINYSDLDETLQVVTGMNSFVDRKCAEFKKLLAVHDTLYNPSEYFVCENRQVCREGDLYSLSRVKRSDAAEAADSSNVGDRLTERCHLILMSDVALLCEPIALNVPNPLYRGPKGKQRKEKTVVKFMIQRVLRKPCCQDKHAYVVTALPKNAFSITAGIQGTLLFRAKSETERDEWVGAFSNSWGIV